jgi:NADH:ubiquinone oxidoreductase subunit F (NADH-binding)
MKSILHFFKHESCGKCVPCRIGTKLLLDEISKQNPAKIDMNFLSQESEYMAKTSLCPLGQSPVLPIKSYIRFFKNFQ